MTLRLTDLPPALRARAMDAAREGLGNSSPRTPVARSAVRAASPPSPQYRCMACGWEFPWTTNKDANPAAWTKHQKTTGHGHARMVLP